MDHATPALRPLAAERSPWLRGTLRVPGDETISHLALILGAVARGETIIEGLREDEGVLATVRAMQALGARVERRASSWHVIGLGVGGFLQPQFDLDFGSSGIGLGLTMGLLGSYSFTTRFVGDALLSDLQLQPLLDVLRAIGVEVIEHDDNRPPIALRGPRTPVPIDVKLPAASAQLKSSLLLAGLVLPGTSSVTEPVLSRDHTERMLETFGARVGRHVDDSGSHNVEIDGLPNLRAQHVLVPADPCAAALGIVAALIVPGSELWIENLLVNPTRMALIDTLLEMGADLEFTDIRQAGGEQIANLRVRHSQLSGVTVPAVRFQSILAEYPALAVAAAFAAGETMIEWGSETTAQERDQLAAVAEGLRANGVGCDERPGGLLVRGSGRVRGGGRVQAHQDHRIATSFLVMGMAADDAVIIDDQSTIALGFPDFIARFEDVGASFIRYTE